MVLCAGCDSPILDRFLSKVEERSWHARCVKCWDCQGVLADKCFARDGKLFCRNDFFRRFGPKCGVCSGALRPTDLVRRARGRVYHVACFTCLLCRRQPDTGEQLYVLDEARFVCRDDYNKHQHTSSSTPPLDSPEPDASPMDSAVASPQGGDSNSEPGVYHDSPQGPSEDLGAEGPGGAKRRGPRTTIKAKQLETLKAAFAATPKPTRHIREQLAQETGLNMRVIQVWFQNRRSKERRMKQLSSLGARRHFFRGPRRALRPLRDEPIPNHTFPYFSDSNSPHDFNYPPHPGFYDYFPHGMPDYPGTVPIPPSDPPHSNGVANLGADAPFMSTPSDCLGTNSSPDNPLPDTNSYQSTFPSFMHETRVW